jgi:hypothetical protein
MASLQDRIVILGTIPDLIDAVVGRDRYNLRPDFPHPVFWLAQNEDKSVQGFIISRNNTNG